MRIRNTPKVFFTDVVSFVQSPINSHPFVEHRETHGGTVGFVPFLYRETGCGISATNVLSILNSYHLCGPRYFTSPRISFFWPVFAE